MNVKRFVGKNAREAMAQARGAWGDQAMVLSNRPVPGGIEILAMAAAEPPHASDAPPMSTVSFQQFVRERQRRDAQVAGLVAARAGAETIASASADASVVASAEPRRRMPPVEPGRFAALALQVELADSAAGQLPAAPPAAAGGQGPELLAELKAMRGMIASQLSSLSWFDTVRRNPAQTQLLRLMIGNGFSPSLARQLVHKLPDDRSESQAGSWLLNVLEKNLRCAGGEAIAQQGGVYALVGPTGVGKTTTTAKIAAHFAMQHGAAAVGLITVDTYRMAASDQLRAFGRILNIPVHTARDSASLLDLLDLFNKKKLVLIDTVGVGQRDRRLTELFSALPADRVTRLLVLNASAQAETLEEVVQAYGAQAGSRCVISKLDEAVKCGGVIDVAIRHQLLVEGFANGQRVPEDWHAARARLLVQKALLKQSASVFTPDDSELCLMLTGASSAGRGVAAMEAQDA